MYSGLAITMTIMMVNRMSGKNGMILIQIAKKVLTKTQL
jgi:hypothetical protein